MSGLSGSCWTPNSKHPLKQMAQQQVKKRSQDQVSSSEDEFDASISEPPRKRLKMQLCPNDMNSPSVNNGVHIENIASNNCSSNNGMMSPQQGGPNINGGNFSANNGIIDVEEDEELMTGIQRLKRLKTLVEYNLITQEDYDARQSQIVDELTGTSASTYISRKRSNYPTSSTEKSHRLSTKTLERLPFHGPCGSPVSPISLNQCVNSPNPSQSNSNSEKKKHKSRRWKTVQVERGIKLSVFVVWENF